MKKLIVYDFDKTIYNGETGTDFFKYYFFKYPIKSIFFLIFYLKDLLLYMFGKISLKILKERFFKFLEGHRNDEIEKIVEKFWLKNSKKIYEWSKIELEINQKEGDLLVVTSASPRFLIEKLLKDLGYDVVFATDFLFLEGSNKFISKIEGENNKGFEKVNKLNKWARLNKIDYEIIKFYSDSLTDKPLYELANEKFWIKNGEKKCGMPLKKTFFDKLFSK